jgi:GMP synthase-like glutamine amidotransferase
MMHRALIFQNAPGEGPGILADCLDRRQWDWEIIDLFQGDAIPADWMEVSLLLVMGGFMNVYEEDAYPFLIAETRVIRKAFDEGLPVTGFCLGAQLMAKALNAGVTKGSKKEIGWYPVRLTKQGLTDPLLSSFPKESMVFQWHGDTFDLPAGAVRIFSSKDYPNQAFCFGEMNYGFQFHFEITKHMIQEWINNDTNEMEEMKTENLEETILKDADSHLPVANALAEIFFTNYLRKIETLPEKQI